MAFYLYQHFSLTALADKFQRLRREGPYFGPAGGRPFRSKDIFVPEKVVVPTYGMRIWLTQYLAQQQSVVANIDFPYPRNFIAEVLKQQFSGRADYRPELFSVEVMAWRIMKIMAADGAADRAAGAADRAEMLSALTVYLQQDDERPALRQYELALRIAGLFDQYMIYRADDLVSWRTALPAADPERWQAALWQQLLVAADGSPLMNPADAFVDYLKLAAGQLQGAVAPVAVFGASTMPPVYLDVLRQWANVTDVHFFYHNPCVEYIGDHPMRGEKVEPTELDEEEYTNKLIENYGLLGREFSKIIQDLKGIYEEGEETAVASGQRESRDTLLTHIQHSVVQVCQSDGPVAVAPTDDSLLFFDCHNALRQVEVLHDRLLALFARNSEAKRGERLYPEDILVMAPDISAMAPAIAAVFDQSILKDHYVISDRSLQQNNAIAAAFASILDLVDGRFEHSRLMALLDVSALRRRFHFDDDETDRLRDWLYQGYVCWGIDRKQRQRDCGIPFDAFSWRHAINRLMLGLALEDVDDGIADGVAGAAPAAVVAGGPRWLQSEQSTWQERLPPLCLADDTQGRALLGNLSNFLEKLVASAEALRKPRPIGEWFDALTTLLSDFFAPDNDSAADYAVVRQTLNDVAYAAKQAGYDEAVPYELIKRLLQEAMATPQKSYPFMSGKITFCSLQPMRSVPRRVIVMLGMDDGAFPRVDSKVGFNVMVRKPRRCDRSRQWEDRYLFLESILAAEERLWIFYNGRNEHRKHEQLPALPVSELRDVVGRSSCLPQEGAAPAGASALSAVTIMAPLHPYDPSCFGAPAAGQPQALFSFNHRYYAIAKEIAAGTNYFAKAHFLDGIGDDGLPPPVGKSQAGIDVADLVKFFSNASEAFMVKTLGFPGREWGERRHGDLEPLTIDEREKTALCKRLAQCQKNRQLTAAECAKLLRRFQADNSLPPGAPGKRLFDECLAQSRFADDATQQAWAEQKEFTLSCDIPLGGAVQTLTGTVRFRPGSPAQCVECLFREKDETSDHRKIAAYIRHLFILVAGGEDARDLKTEVYPSVDSKAPLAIDSGLTPENAQDKLGRIVGYYLAGLRVPAALLAKEPLKNAKDMKTLRSNWDKNTNDPFFGRLYSPDQKKDDGVLEKFAAAANECFGDIANIK